MSRSAIESLRHAIEALCEGEPVEPGAARTAVDELLTALEDGRVRSVEPVDGVWKVHAWVKRGILLGFRIGGNVAFEGPGGLRFRDRETFPPLDVNRLGRDVRVVPGGSAVRRGAYLAGGVVLMPPSYVNVGAWVGEGTMVDSHALVGSCAQIGRDVHLSAAAQIGGVLEPIGAMPVIVEDEAFIGGGCGIYDGTRVGAGAVLAAGVVLTGSTPIYDLVHGRLLRPGADGVLEVPSRAVVVPGSRPATGDYAEQQGIQLQTPVIVKYRDGSSDARLSLEEALR